MIPKFVPFNFSVPEVLRISYICMVILFDSINHAQEGFENSKLTGHDDDEFAMLTINDIFIKEQVMDTFGDNSFHQF
jgi:hypothetical protein